jgi:hypothetical protein
MQASWRSCNKPMRQWRTYEAANWTGTAGAAGQESDNFPGSASAASVGGEQPADQPEDSENTLNPDTFHWARPAVSPSGATSPSMSDGGPILGGLDECLHSHERSPTTCSRAAKARSAVPRLHFSPSRRARPG